MPFDDDLALRDDREPVGELVGLLEVVRGEQDRQRLRLGEPRHLVPHHDARLGIEAGRRLVEEQHARAVHEPERDVEPAAHPAGVRLDDPVGGVGDADELEQLVVRARRSLPPIPWTCPWSIRFSRPVPSWSTPESCGT